MGTALQSTDDRNDIRAIKRMIREIKSGTPKRRALDIALGEATNAVVFEGPEIAPIRRTVSAAIAKRIKEDVLDKFTHWIKVDKRNPKKFPFKAKRARRRRPTT
jgi:hypothetical protein